MISSNKSKIILDRNSGIELETNNIGLETDYIDNSKFDDKYVTVTRGFNFCIRGYSGKLVGDNVQIGNKCYRNANIPISFIKIECIGGTFIKDNNLSRVTGKAYYIDFYMGNQHLNQNLIKSVPCKVVFEGCNAVLAEVEGFNND